MDLLPRAHAVEGDRLTVNTHTNFILRIKMVGSLFSLPLVVVSVQSIGFCLLGMESREGCEDRVIAMASVLGLCTSKQQCFTACSHHSRLSLVQKNHHGTSYLIQMFLLYLDWTGYMNHEFHAIIQASLFQENRLFYHCKDSQFISGKPIILPLQRLFMICHRKCYFVK